MRCYHTRTLINPHLAPPTSMTPPTTIKFGTDGWRALIARDFTFANVRACAEGVSRLLLEDGTAERGLVVGYDTRFGSPEFAAEVAQVTTANGIPTYLCDRVTPTPVVSYNIVRRQAGGGVVITASHNPARLERLQIQAVLRRQRVARDYRPPGSPHRRRCGHGLRRYTPTGAIAPGGCAGGVQPGAALSGKRGQDPGPLGHPGGWPPHRRGQHARRGRGLPAPAAGGRAHVHHGAAGRAQSAVPRHGPAGAHRSESP